MQIHSEHLEIRWTFVCSLYFIRFKKFLKIELLQRRAYSKCELPNSVFFFCHMRYRDQARVLSRLVYLSMFCRILHPWFCSVPFEKSKQWASVGLCFTQVTLSTQLVVCCSSIVFNLYVNVRRVIGYCDRVRSFPRFLLVCAVRALELGPDCFIAEPCPVSIYHFLSHSTLYNLCSFNNVIKQLYNQSVIGSTFSWFHNLSEKHQTK